METIIKNESVGNYKINNLEINTTYVMTHLEGEEPKIEKKDGNPITKKP